MTFGSDSVMKIERWFSSNNIPLPRDFIDKAGLFYELIRIWSVRMNIVSKGDLPFLVDRHILDSISPVESIPRSGRMIDVGSGGGFPAIPIALLRPGLEITLLESQHKKVLFLKEMKKQLLLKNTEIVESRLEEYKPEVLFDIATVRALPRWSDHLVRLKALINESGRIIYYEKRGKYRIIERQR